MVAAADATLVVSPVERDLLMREVPGARVEVLSNVHRIAGPGLPFAQRRDLVFVGGFRHPPNADAVVWFAREIFPLIRAQAPDIRFHVIGGDVPDDPYAAVTSWREALAQPNAMGLVLGRSLLFPRDGDVAANVDRIVEVL